MTLKKIKEIISIFQNGILVELGQSGSDVSFKLDCAFLADLIQTDYHYFYGVFKQCSDVFFQPWDDEFYLISDTREIQQLGLELLSVELEDDGYVKIFTNCNHRFSGGNLLIKAGDIRIFDEDFQELTLLNLIELSERYWFLSDNATEG